jgi:hypothetical protein
MNSFEPNNPLELKKWTKQVLSDEVAKQLCKISEDSFPPEEREPCQTLIKAIQEGKGILYTASVKNTIRGFTKLTPLKKTNVFLMEYLAVDISSRNQGIGGKILQFIKKDLRTGNAAGLILEVEPPDETSGEEKEIRQRRIWFYQCNGGQIVLDRGAYRMPNLACDGSLPMHLMWLPINAGGRPPANLSLSELFTLIFTETYGGTKNDALLHTIISELPYPNAPIELGKCQNSQHP